MNETKAAIAERKIWSLKNILYLYMEDYGYKYILKRSQLVTTQLSRKNCSTDLIPKMSGIRTFRPFCTTRHYENIEI